MGNNPSGFKDDECLPVSNVSWDDCQEFIKSLNTKGKGTFRLPTESEWEYACRAGSTTAYCFGDDVSRLGDYAWYDNNSSLHTHPAGCKKPNAWNLYDMHGNIMEWCQDWHGKYPTGSVTDPTVLDSGKFRVLRGGYYAYHADGCRSAHRNSSTPDAQKHFGLRIVRTV
jgi:formylglycine-generating enzyme required for sulfatase activity